MNEKLFTHENCEQMDVNLSKYNKIRKKFIDQKITIIYLSYNFAFVCMILLICINNIKLIIIIIFITINCKYNFYHILNLLLFLKVIVPLYLLDKFVYIFA